MFKPIESDKKLIISFNNLFYNPSDLMDVFNIFKLNIDKITDIREDSLNLIRQKILINGIYDIDTSRWSETIQYTSSLNNKILKYISSCNQFNISRFLFLDNSYKPLSINYNKCICNSIYGNVFNLLELFTLQKNSIIGLSIKPLNGVFLNTSIPKFWFKDVLFKGLLNLKILVLFKYKTQSNLYKAYIKLNDTILYFNLSNNSNLFNKIYNIELNKDIRVLLGFLFNSNSLTPLIVYKPSITKVK